MDRGMLLHWLFWTLAVCTYTTFADVNCYHEQDLQRQCFINQSIDVTLPVYSTEDTNEDRRNNYVETIIAQKPGQMCRQQREFKLALECAMTHTIKCMPTDYQGYLPQPKMMAKVVDKLCDNETEIDFNCVMDKAAALFECGYKKGQEAFAGETKITLEKVLCKAFQFNAACQRTELRSCGCATVKAYESISRNLLYPPACPRPILHDPPVGCNTKNSRLFLDNKAGYLTASITFYLIAVLTTYVIRRSMHV